MNFILKLLLIIVLVPMALYALFWMVFIVGIFAVATL
jgi:hypothetical protein